jgi:5'-AMP-activated protein kinase catalytic alpha subunit
MPHIISNHIEPSYLDAQHVVLLPKMLGCGARSTIHLALNQLTNQFIVAKRTLLSNHLKTYLNEVFIHGQLNHPKIVKMYGYSRVGAHGLIFMEKALGDNLFEYVNIVGKGIGIPERTAVKIFWDVVNAIDYMHDMGICHHDLKSENIVYDELSNVAKLLDFGESVKLLQDETLLHHCSGSPLYSAPEVLKCASHDPKKSDVWSLGVILYFMLVGDYPWSNIASLKDLIEYVDKENIEISYPNIQLSQCLKDLIQKILQRDPNKRLLLKDIIKIFKGIKKMYV